MSVAPRRWAADLLYVWFHELSPSDWFGSGQAVDAMLAERFGKTLDALSGQLPTSFLSDPKLAQAAILLFDQVPRNIYRDDARAFATDPLALTICKHMIVRGWDARLPDAQRQFIAMPLMHSEAIADQRASVAYFARHLPQNLSFARSHRTMIARFGRFPHRNEVLGRKTTGAEQAAIDAGFSW